MSAEPAREADAPRLTHADPARRERAGVDYPNVTWTSFDRYGRYGAAVRALRANLGPDPLTVLDVGDDSGWLSAFDADIMSVSVDVNVNPQRLDSAHVLVADGARLPVRDGGFAGVISCDALEHVEPHHRAAFVAELGRVSSDLVVLAAPFDTPGVAGAEEFVRRYVHALTGDPQPQLEEHAAHGLPGLDATVAAFEDVGLSVAVMGNGNLQDWLLGMLVKHQLGAPELRGVDIAFDQFYNGLFDHRHAVPPFYRQVLVARRAVAPVLPRWPSAPTEMPGASPDVIGALLVASAAEANRRDVGRTLQDIASHLDRLEVQHRTAAEHFMERFSGVEATLLRVASTIDAMVGAVRHPVRAVGRLRARGATSSDGT